MSAFTIYHNPKCSKSRQALDILNQHHVNPIIIEYLKTPLTLEQLHQLRAQIDLSDLIRYTEPVFKALNLTLDDEDNVLKALLQEPSLLQRPIITYGEKMIIARPPEKVLELIRDAKKIIEAITII